MNIADILDKNSVEIGAEIATKDEALKKLISIHKKCGNIKDEDAFRADIERREREGSTALSGRIALPYAKSDSTLKTSVAAITIKDGVDFTAQDNKKVRLIFMITGSNDDEYLRLRTRLIRLLLDSGFVSKLYSAATKEDFIELMREKETNRFSENRIVRDCSKILSKQNKLFKRKR